ncbi:MAG: hypothetical protein FWD38_04050 [Oscillospiraceae bacterium]|nr:hypothetical protein [Oscillospiraceae bacterium]
MIKDFIKRAKNGESVYISEVRDAFLCFDSKVECIIETTTGETKTWDIHIPEACDMEESKFIRRYFFSNIYNIISTYGGKQLVIKYDEDAGHIKELCAALNDTFQVKSGHADRSGYGKCLNVTDRINAAFGYPPFRFVLTSDKAGNKVNNQNGKTADSKACNDAIQKYKKAVKASSDAVLIGLDIGGTDIKAVGTISGNIAALLEYDWNPASMTRVSEMTGAIEFVLSELCSKLGADNIPDGIGIGFPDVIINNKIVGGETLKTRGMRKASADYEAEFAKLLDIDKLLLKYCKPNAVINKTNDGSLAAFTAAVELAHCDRADEIKNGVFAHTLGTELGTGWVDENGEIPQIPLEIYNCVIDLGNYPACEYKPFDLRSTLNFNTEIAGTMQKYASQSGAYRLALEFFEKEAPDIYEKLFEKGFIEEKENGIYVVVSPTDMRKPFLGYIMKLADDGQPQAKKIFREIGKYLAATWLETEFLLNPAAKNRILYGRFVKSQKCFTLMQEGASELFELSRKGEKYYKNEQSYEGDISYEAGDNNLAFTPLMKQLKSTPNYTVAQFAQSIGAIHFAAM